ncbi:putative membrane protein [Rubidibacter lacunae KORDI 51-2]|uniref:Putative membrane protein n=1 Tax=Rubidibacter lacunae KORDI 51-2 TaxID=582515 RepID=U5DHX9_9CHRO|nr:DUF2232 domain-containing protein [Rubidibacter lacunae]ERN40214.1 putative membrane protein [Rubidibacter lacunae KORDI 51-2]
MPFDDPTAPDKSRLRASGDASDETDEPTDSPDDDENWVDAGDESGWDGGESLEAEALRSGPPSRSLAMVETAFLASASGLIWLINTYFPPGPLLRVAFPIPIALAYLRRGPRAGWMACAIAGLLLTVLMGPTRSVLFVMPFGVMGVQLGACWRRGTSWMLSILLGALLGAIGFFFRFWLASLLLGEDLWAFALVQVAGFLEWAFVKLGILAQPSLELIQSVALVAVFVNSLIYLFVVHLVALAMLDRLGNPIPRPPQWIRDIFDYE